MPEAFAFDHFIRNEPGEGCLSPGSVYPLPINGARVFVFVFL